jgi:hypothetical protein
MANSGGGLVVVGVNDDGVPTQSDLTAILGLDPAILMDKVYKYTGIHVAGCAVAPAVRQGVAVAAICVPGANVPIVFAQPGSYDAGGGKQKTVFGRGTVYFRHGAKSEPGTTDDIRAAQERAVERLRSSWLDGIQKVVTAPAGAIVRVLPVGDVAAGISAGIRLVPKDVSASAADTGEGIRLVNDPAAPAFKSIVGTDVLFPYRQKEIVTRVNELLKGAKVTSHDIVCVRRHHNIAAQPNFFHKLKFSSPQYSEAFALWLAERYAADDEFFAKARHAPKKNGSGDVPSPVSGSTA